MKIYCPKCKGMNCSTNMDDEFVVAPVNDDTGVVSTCPDCGASFLIEITFYSLNAEDEGEAYCG